LASLQWSRTPCPIHRTEKGGVKIPAKVFINQDALERLTLEDPRARAYIQERAQAIVDVAKADFERQQRHDNELRTSETTPPKYLEEFQVEVYPSEEGLKFRILNTDPAASWVEYGAHAGGKTFVLRYKPMTHAVEIVSGVSIP
jgi:hypothetical protein